MLFIDYFNFVSLFFFYLRFFISAHANRVQISHEWAFCVVVLDLPKYMNDVLHFSIQDNGVYSSIPQAIKLVLALLTGALNDWLVAVNYMTITNARKIFVAVGMYLAVFSCMVPSF